MILILAVAVTLPLALRGDDKAVALPSGPVPVSTLSINPFPSSVGRIALPRPTASRPLRIYFDGDSVAGIPSLQFKALAQKDARFKPTSHYHTSTRIADPQNVRLCTPHRTWIAHVRAVVASTRAKAVVFMIGANDPSMPIGDLTGDKMWTRAWKTAYRKRVGALMDAMIKAGVKRIYWVGMPPMKSSTGYPNSGQMKYLNDAFYREALERRGTVKYIAVWKLLLNESGTVDMQWRSSDGVHLNTAGGRRVASYIMKRVKADWLPPR